MGRLGSEMSGTRAGEAPISFGNRWHGEGRRLAGARGVLGRGDGARGRGNSEGHIPNFHVDGVGFELGDELEAD